MNALVGVLDWVLCSSDGVCAQPPPTLLTSFGSFSLGAGVGERAFHALENLETETEAWGERKREHPGLAGDWSGWSGLWWGKVSIRAEPGFSPSRVEVAMQGKVIICRVQETVNTWKICSLWWWLSLAQSCSLLSTLPSSPVPHGPACSFQQNQWWHTCFCGPWDQGFCVMSCLLGQPVPYL